MVSSHAFDPNAPEKKRFININDVRNGNTSHAKRWWQRPVKFTLL